MGKRCHQLLFGVLVFLGALVSPCQARVLHLYSWWQMFPEHVLKQFEKETGIRVINDLMDSNEVLDAKLSSRYTGYDLVTPSFLPFAVRQMQGGAYMPIDKEKIPTWKMLDPELLAKMASFDPLNQHAVPIAWGAVALSYDEQKILSLMPSAPLDSWALLFDDQVVKHFTKCGTVILEEPYDVLVPALLYWDMGREITLENLQRLQDKLMTIRPHISRFDSLRSAEDLVMGNSCLAMQWAGSVEYALAQDDPGQRKKVLKTVIPKEGTVMWVDVLAIPEDAPHPEEAHAFINFILQPHIMAEITNATYYANSVPASLPYIRGEIRDNKAIYPEKKRMKKIYLNTLEPPQIVRHIHRIMTRFRRGEK